ncbi:hypothetical protein MMC25_008089 [Agyrium rufum]|nr:hypothetical protein [Agyrium rufum]
MSNAVMDDTGVPLAELKIRARQSLGRSIQQIYERYRSVNDKSNEFLSNLKCFLPESADSRQTSHGKTQLLPCSFEHGYVAISYPWKASDGEDESMLGYSIPQSTVPFGVRDTVLDRTISFIRYQHPKPIPLWIDKLSINQENKREKEMAMQSMDMVYRECTFGVGYLWVKIEKQVQLDRLSALMTGRIVRDQRKNPPILKDVISPQTAREVLDVLDRITDDQWWTRAWIFQEDYLVGTKMWLLIRHSPELDKSGTEKEFGRLSEELVVRSQAFRKYATLFCLACLQRMGQNHYGSKMCDKILQKAGRYDIIRRYGYRGIERNLARTMTVDILKELDGREITCQSDIPAIAANICGYDVRIPISEDCMPQLSLSLVLLTLFVANGEIIHYDKRETNLRENIFNFLDKRSLRVTAPLQDGVLTFIKHCRLSIDNLSTSGMHTKGVLWQLSDVIGPSHFPLRPPFKSPNQRQLYRKGPDSTLRVHLEDLLTVLQQRNKKRYGCLVDDLAAYLQSREQPITCDSWPSSFCMSMMAACIAEAMSAKKYLQLARPVGVSPNRGRGKPYRGVFIRDRKELKGSGPSYIFTSWTRTRKRVRDGRRHEMLAKYVSMEVGINELGRLRSKNWTNGLCFFDGEEKDRFIFAWPESFCT